MKKRLIYAEDLKQLRDDYISGKVKIDYIDEYDMVDCCPTADVVVQEWINASDNPPKEDGEYIIHVKNLTGFHVLDRNVFEATYAFGQWIFDGCSDNRVTHWMCLPKPLKEGD